MNLLGSVRNHLLNLRGRSISRKVIVFESDDWGTIRIPSYSAYQRLKNQGVDLDSNPYNRFDTLETANDVEALAEVLERFKDSSGRNPMITTNFIVANPNFERIRKSNFSGYSFELFLDTYRRSKKTEDTWPALQDAIKQKLIHPQFHGREHVNAVRWLNLLREGNALMLTAFQECVFSIDVQAPGKKRTNLMAALDFANQEEKNFAMNQLIEGTEIFSRVFGYRSQSFIAPANVWSDEVEQALKQAGVDFFQSLRGQLVPVMGQSTYDTKIRYSGEYTSAGQLLTVRNVYFEPTTLPGYDWIGNCIRKIQAAFFWNKPAIVSTHRLNYVGGIKEENRQTNLSQLKSLLTEILIRWPDVEFMTSDELGHLYKSRECVE